MPKTRWWMCRPPTDALRALPRCERIQWVTAREAPNPEKNVSDEMNIRSRRGSRNWRP